MKTLPFLGRVLTLSVPLQAFSVLIKWQTLPRWLRITMYKLPCTIVQNLNVKKKRLKSILEKRENKKHQPFNRGFFWLARCVLRKKKKKMKVLTPTQAFWRLSLPFSLTPPKLFFTTHSELLPISSSVLRIDGCFYVGSGVTDGAKNDSKIEARRIRTGQYSKPFG